MEYLEHGDAEDLRSRLSTLPLQQRRLIPVLGSAMSNAAIPSASDIVSLMRSALPASQRQDFDRKLLESPTDADRYQAAARILKFKVSEDRVVQVIRSAVLRACRSVELAQTSDTLQTLGATACRQLEQDGEWIIPKAHVRFARYYAELPGQLRGPIITTNFDPLIELALRAEGVSTHTIPISADNAPTIDQLETATAVPILHIHGYWTSTGLVNTISQLAKPRPTVNGLLRHLLTESVVLVLGYGGWKDAFMQALLERVQERDLYESEIVWCSYNSDPSDVLKNTVVGALQGSPGFSLYAGIDVNTVLDELLLEAALEDLQPGPQAPFGYSRVRPTQNSGNPSTTPFIDGGPPSWADAAEGQWPRLSATDEMILQLEHRMNSATPGIVAGIGPVGEGKSLALRQVALHAANTPGWTVLWREPAAPRISREWLAEVADSFGNAVICVDEADTVLGEILDVAVTMEDLPATIVFAVASHDRMWWSRGGRTLSNAEVIIFSGITDGDASNLAAAYKRHEIRLTGGGLGPNSSEADLAQALLASAENPLDSKQSSLLGAVLELRNGPALKDRVADLVDKLNGTKLTKSHARSLGEVFLAICLLQRTWDPEMRAGDATDRALLAMLADGESEYPSDERVLKQLGREAAISVAGDSVYARHPAIARIALEVAERQGTLGDVAQLVGYVGGLMRCNQGMREKHYRNAYLISQKLSGDVAVRAASGAIQGAPRLLEPRITRISTLRKVDPAGAAAYAEGVAREAATRDDIQGAMRVFLNEFARVRLANHEPESALGLAALALDDRSGLYLDRPRAGYALGSVAAAAAMLRVQNRESAGAVPEIAYVLFARVAGGDAARRHARAHIDATALSETESLSTRSLIASFSAALNPFASRARMQSFVRDEFDGFLRLQDLEGLAG